MKCLIMSVIFITFCFNANAYNNQSIAEKIQVLKQQAVKLHKDLAQLEQDLIYPSTTQIAIYVAKNVNKEILLASVELSVDDKIISSHIYTSDQNKALELGGMQRLFIGNLKVGEHVFNLTVKAVDSDDNVIVFKGDNSFYKDGEPLSLKVDILYEKTDKVPLISITRL